MWLVEGIRSLNARIRQTLAADVTNAAPAPMAPPHSLRRGKQPRGGGGGYGSPFRPRELGPSPTTGGTIDLRGTTCAGTPTAV